MATKYMALRGFAAVGENNVKKYFSPGNAHEIADLPDAEIKKHVKAGNIAEYEEEKQQDVPLESAPAGEDTGASKASKKKGDRS